MAGIAEILHEQGRLEESLKAFAQALEIGRGVLGNDSERLAALLYGISKVYSDVGSQQQAKLKAPTQNPTPTSQRQRAPFWPPNILALSAHGASEAFCSCYAHTRSAEIHSLNCPLKWSRDPPSRGRP